MCGIAGIYNFDKNREINRYELQGLNDSISHRGPDDEGMLIDKNIGLAHRRLSIIDLQKGAQPMRDAGTDITIVYNGEIYNYRELQTDLLKLGYSFQTECDTEVILKAYREWRFDCVQKFNGMWSFAILDRSGEQPLLFCSRDRMGIKPFYYYKDKDRFVFASEIKAFSSLDYFNSDLNYDSLWDALVYGPIDEGPTWLKGVEELGPGQNLIVSGKKVKKNSYFRLSESFADQSDKYNLSELSDLVNDAVRLRLRSDVPLATINSGGLDSSLISSIANQHITDLNTYSVAPEHGTNNEALPGDESRYARQLAEILNTNHKTVRYSKREFIEHLEEAVCYNDGFLFHSNSIPMFLLFEKIKKDGTTVVLGGEGADEVFRGYYSNKILHLLKFSGTYMGKAILSAKYHQRSHLFELEHNPKRMIPLIRNNSLSPDDANKILDYKGELSPSRAAIFDTMRKLSADNALSYFEQRSYLSGLLKRADRMSMAHGIELRVPFLDHRLVLKLNAIKQSQKTGRFLYKEKDLLNRIARPYLPSSILERKKYGFASPLTEYREVLRSRLKETAINSNGYDYKKLWILNALLPLNNLKKLNS